MLPVYQAKRFHRILSEGGFSKPWLVEVEVEGVSPFFVMKVYTTEHIEARNCVTAEVVGHLLACAFDFKTPNAALIEVESETFRMSLPHNAGLLLDTSVDERIKFGTTYIDGVAQANVNQPLSEYEPSFLDTLYAFDNFIRNEDRRQRNPNLLQEISTGEMVLIDHGLALQDVNRKNISSLLEEITTEQWRDKMQNLTLNHFAYPYLSIGNAKEKSEYFDTFAFYLKLLDISVIHTYLSQLEKYGYHTEKESILSYFSFIKKNASLFIKMLKQSIK
ncbi:MAG: HipA family kinase [Bacteroidia bacterium]